MNKFVQFIKGNPKPDFYEFTMGGRFKDLIFKIKGDLPLEIQEQIEKRCAIRDKKGNQIDTNKAKLALKMIEEYSIEPNFRNANDLKELGLTLPEDYIKAMFTSGEQLAFMGKINELTGVGADINEEIEEAKN